jgi:hypothetical protein
MDRASIASSSARKRPHWQAWFCQDDKAVAKSEDCQGGWKANQPHFMDVGTTIRHGWFKRSKDFADNQSPEAQPLPGSSLFCSVFASLHVSTPKSKEMMYESITSI